ncbi:MAG: glycoside hydrolase family 3 N-terminal domain-containing protein [Lachnospiraceae bacterium]
MELTQNKEKNEAYKKRAAELVSRMTLEAKIQQMVFRAPAIPELHIKAYTWWNEALHGVARAGTATVFPQAIGLAATFDEDLVETVADAIATEARAKFNVQQQYEDTDAYKGLTFWAPNVNIFRDPRWGRGHETYGEDPYLTARMGVRFIQGLQGHDENYLKTAACAKHFAVHSGPENMRHYFDARVNKKDLRETYLPAFQACVQEAKVEAVMGAYNRTNGEPCCGSKTLLQDILRDEWGFDGHVVSDCWAIQDFHEHHKVTETPTESAALAVNHGCDLNCGEMFYYLLNAVKEGKVTEDMIDQAVTRLFTTRMRLGLLDEREEIPFSDISYLEVDSPKMRKLNQEAAAQGLVLLRNEGHTLPLQLDGLRTIGVVGPNANNRRALVGNYEGTASRYVTVLEGIQDYVGEKARVIYSEACHLYREKCGDVTKENDRISELRAVIDQSDVVIACLGLDSGLEGEEGDQGNAYASGDKQNLSLPGKQTDVLRILAECKKPVILLLLSGSALILENLEEQFPAIMQCFYPGAEGGHAIAQTLFGERSPEGKLPVTFYRSTEELPEFTDYSMKNRTYRYMKKEALYPFGYGLSYADMHLALTQGSNAARHISHSELVQNGLEIACVLENRSAFDAGETIQVYVHAETLEGEAATKIKQEELPNAQLKALKKLHLKAGEMKNVSMTLGADAFRLCDENGEFGLYPGTYTVSVGFHQPDQRSFALTGQENQVLTVLIEA